MRVSEIRVKQNRVNQGLGVRNSIKTTKNLHMHCKYVQGNYSEITLKKL